MSDATRNLTDKATYERLEKDVTAVKNDIAALTEQITDALNNFAGTAGKQARRGYKQARASAEQAVDDMSERGSAMMDAAQGAALTAGCCPLSSPDRSPTPYNSRVAGFARPPAGRQLPDGGPSPPAGPGAFRPAWARFQPFPRLP